MRDVALGQWSLFVWHLPTMLLAGAALGLAAWMARSLLRDQLGARAREIRYNVIGWASMFASVASVVAWPYLNAVAEVRVAEDGQWSLENYLGFELARIPPGEARSLHAYDLGGLHLGVGHIEFERASGQRLRSVRLGGYTFERMCTTLGYPRSLRRESGGLVVVPAHRYRADGPWMLLEVASR